MIFPAGGCYKFRNRYSGRFLVIGIPFHRFYMIFMHSYHPSIDFSGFLRILEVLPGVVTNCRSVIPNFRRAQWIQIWFLEEVQEGRVFRPGPDGIIKPGHLISGDVSVKWDLFKVGTRIGPKRSTKIQKSWCLCNISAHFSMSNQKITVTLCRLIARFFSFPEPYLTFTYPVAYGRCIRG